MPTQYRGQPSEVRALNALINFFRASDAVAAALQQSLLDRGVTTSQLGILEALLHLGPMCQGELASKQLRSCASMTSVVEGLEKRGWLVRKRTEEDKRSVRVALTSKGRKLIEEIFPGHVRAVTKLFGGLTETEQEDLRRLCRKLGGIAGRS